MSRARSYGSLLAAVAAVFVVSCTRGRSATLSFVGKVPVDIDISCDANPVTINLTDRDGNAAWKVDTENRRITWRVKNSNNRITINAIQQKGPGDWPVEVDPNEHGGSGGKPYKARIKRVDEGGPPTGRSLPYAIDVTCQPQSGNPVRLLIDPEMIVR